MYMKDAIAEYGFDCRIRKLSPNTVNNDDAVLRKTRGSPWQEQKRIPAAIGSGWIAGMHCLLLLVVRSK